MSDWASTADALTLDLRHLNGWSPPSLPSGGNSLRFTGPSMVSILVEDRLVFFIERSFKMIDQSDFSVICAFLPTLVIGSSRGHPNLRMSPRTTGRANYSKFKVLARCLPIPRTPEMRMEMEVKEIESRIQSFPCEIMRCEIIDSAAQTILPLSIPVAKIFTNTPLQTSCPRTVTCTAGV